MAAADVGLAALVRRRARAVEPLFGADGELYPVWAEAALLGWAGVQASAALRPTPAAARRVALVRALLVPGGFWIAATRTESPTRRRMYAGAATGNALSVVAALVLARRLW
jgi:hypothetical protein